MISHCLTAVIFLISLQANAQTAPRSFRPSTSRMLPRSRLTTPPSTSAADETEDEEEEDEPKTTSPALKFENADAQFLMDAYAKETGRTLLISPDVPKVQSITLRSQRGLPLTREEYLEAIEVTLSMNGIVLEPFGEKFLRALPRKSIRAEGIKITMEKPEGGHPEKSRVISQMIQLKAISISEAQKALEGFKRPDGLIQSFERTNSLLVTDTQENINRMLEIVRFIDQPLVATEEVNVRVIRYAKAEEIKKRLEEIVAESQKQTSTKDEIKPNASGAPGMSRSRSTSSLIRPGLSRFGRPPVTATPVPTANANISTMVSDADRGMIRGKVQIISDERSNQLIIITRKDNMEFFDKIITVLDIETAPDVKVEVRRLEYADAEEVSTMLNDLIGNTTSKKDDNSNTSNKNTANTSAKSSSLNEAAAARSKAPAQASKGSAGKGASGETAKLGQLSKDNIKILADKRTNAIVMMGSPTDLKAINELIAGMDIQLSQVLIETVVLQVELGDDLKTGIDWVKRGKHTSYVENKDRPIHRYDESGNLIMDGDKPKVFGYRKDRVVTRDTIFNNGDQLSGGGSGSELLGNLLKDAVEAGTNAVSNLLGPRSGISYFLKSDKLDIAALIEASKSDSRAKVLSSPVLMTVDNKEATIEATSMRYLYKGVRYSGSSYNGSEVPDYEQRDIGLTVKITPRINPNGTVVLTIEETFETIGANQTVGKESYPTVNTRKLQADVSVENAQTVVLGGLVQNEIKESESGIPLLKDIPYIGKYLFGSTSYEESRSELLVFLTPYVMDTAEALTAEAQRRKAALSDDRPWVDYGWSRSKLADPVSPREKMRRLKQRWKNEDTDHDAEKLYKKAMKAREKQLRERDAKEKREAEKEAAEEAGEGKAAQEKSWVSGIKVSDSTEVIKPNAEKKSAEKKESPTNKGTAVPVVPPRKEKEPANVQKKANE